MPDKRPKKADAIARRSDVHGSKRVSGELRRTIYKTTKLSIKLAGGGLVLIFGWLKLNGAEFAPIARTLSAGLVLKTSLALYYACWVAGALMDTETQEGLYSAQPNEGRMPPLGYAFMLMLTVVFGVLCWVKTYTQFAVTLTAFLLVDHAAWLYLTRRVLPPVVARSRIVFGQAPFKLERLRLVFDQYLCGRWKLMRLAAGAAVLIALNVLAFSDILDRFHIKADLTLSGVILFYVLLMESWIWLERLRLGISLTLLDYLDEHYVATLA